MAVHGRTTEDACVGSLRFADSIPEGFSRWDGPNLEGQIGTCIVMIWECEVLIDNSPLAARDMLEGGG